MAKKRTDFSVTTFSEVRTAGGQLIEFNCVPEDVDKIKNCLGSLVRDIELLQTEKMTSVSQGGYGRYSRFKIVQHDYAGGGYPGCGGYIEVLEIKNPIDGKCAIVLHEYRIQEYSVTCYFTEWDCIHNAIDAFQKSWHSLGRDYSNFPGFRRKVECGRLTPWFYAIGDQEIVGDYAFPEGLQEDSVYKFGKEFVVYVDSGHKDDKKPVIKTCMGCRVVMANDKYGSRSYRIVYWNDGTVWDGSNTYKAGRPPRPIEEADDEDLWAHEIRRQLPFLKNGKKMVINFADGRIFEGVFRKRESSTPKGKYYVEVTLKGKDEDNDDVPIQGWVDFTPTEKCPTLTQYVLGIFRKHKVVVNKIQIKKKENVEGNEPNLFFVLEGLRGA